MVYMMVFVFQRTVYHEFLFVRNKSYLLINRESDLSFFVQMSFMGQSNVLFPFTMHMYLKSWK